jgi:hypothetical protein
VSSLISLRSFYLLLSSSLLFLALSVVLPGSLFLYPVPSRSLPFSSFPSSPFSWVFFLFRFLQLLEYLGIEVESETITVESTWSVVVFMPLLVT